MAFLGRVALGAALLGLTACGSVPLRGPTPYSLSHALFNEPIPVRPARRRQAVKKPARPTPSATVAAAAAPVASPVSTPSAVERPTAERVGRQRALMLATAQQLVGLRGAFDARGYVHHLLEAGDVRLSGISAKPSIRDVFRALQAQHLTYDRSEPAAGDLVFFHNTEDQNRDGRQNDWYSLAGVVETVAADGTVTAILPSGGAIVRRVMNLRTPEIRRAGETGPIVNDVLRKKRLDDPPYTQYLAGELYAGFAAVP